LKPATDSYPLVLWIDPLEELAPSQQEVLHRAGWSVRHHQTPESAQEDLSRASLVVLHLTPQSSALSQTFEVMQHHGLTMPVVCRVQSHQLELAMIAMHAGALTVISTDDLDWNRWVELRQQIQERSSTSKPSKISRKYVFVDPASQLLLALAQRVAQADVTTLLVGPTGSGKEVMARVLHESSPRNKGPFIALNCAAMPDHLIEDMLFGHEKGAFTGAHKDHKGLFEQAQGGTLFLDEIGEMPIQLQSKLLRVLQERHLTRLGGQQSIAINVRIVAATNKDLKKAIEEKEFREDLYYRIATFRLRLLPLSERPQDIVPLALQCLMDTAPHQRWQINAQAQCELLRYTWPGNVRELENVMRRATVLCPDHVVTPMHLMFDDWLMPEGIKAPPSSNGSERFASAESHGMPMDSPPSSVGMVVDLQLATRQSEHQVIMATLAQTSNREEAARQLGISPRTLRYKIAQFKAMGLGMAA
jgi:two-component system response regulator FlrC